MIHNIKRDLILISAYCDNSSKMNLLRDLVLSLKKFDKFDILISSHSLLPEDITQNCDYFFYDSKNILLEDFDLRAAAWFKPDNDNSINSIFMSFSNTHLAVWRLIIFGNQIAKNLGYKKIHHIEYDTKIEKIDEILNNSELLETYDIINYNIVDENILLGSYQAYNVDKIHNLLINYDENKILNMIRSSIVKSPEIFLEKLLHKNTKYFVKNIYNREVDGISFALSCKQTNYISWCLPYYNKTTNKLCFLVWNHNMKGTEENIDVCLIYNKQKVFNIENIKKQSWRLIELDDYDNSQELIVILNNKIRDIYNFNLIRESFKKHSYKNS